MKTWIVVALLVAALYWEHRRKLNQKNQRRGVGRARTINGVVPSTGSGVRQATQFSTTGSRSQGSGHRGDPAPATVHLGDRRQVWPRACRSDVSAAKFLSDQ